MAYIFKYMPSDVSEISTLKTALGMCNGLEQFTDLEDLAARADYWKDDPCDIEENRCPKFKEEKFPGKKHRGPGLDFVTAVTDECVKTDVPVLVKNPESRTVMRRGDLIVDTRYEFARGKKSILPDFVDLTNCSIDVQWI